MFAFTSDVGFWRVFSRGRPSARRLTLWARGLIWRERERRSCFERSCVAGARVGRECVQGSEGEAYHATPLAAGYPWGRGAGQPDQGDHRGRRRDPAHPQVADRQEGGPLAARIERHIASLQTMYSCVISECVNDVF